MIQNGQTHPSPSRRHSRTRFPSDDVVSSLENSALDAHRSGAYLFKAALSTPRAAPWDMDELRCLIGLVRACELLYLLAALWRHQTLNTNVNAIFCHILFATECRPPRHIVFVASTSECKKMRLFMGVKRNCKDGLTMCIFLLRR